VGDKRLEDIGEAPRPAIRCTLCGGSGINNNGSEGGRTCQCPTGQRKRAALFLRHDYQRARTDQTP